MIHGKHSITLTNALRFSVIEMRKKYKETNNIISYKSPPLDDNSDIMNAIIYHDSPDKRENFSIRNSYQFFIKHLCQQFHMLNSFGIALDFCKEGKFNIDSIEENHPMSVQTEFRDSKKNQLNAYDVFKCVHSIIADNENDDFSIEEEKKAWLRHRSILPREAHLALWNETRGKNAWVNAGPHVRKSDNKGFYFLVKKEEEGWIPLEKRPFPVQKCVLAPDWAI